MFSDFSEAALEVIAQEGQGPGGLLHRVKDTRTGTIMARKTIVISNASATGQDPINRLLRELNIIRSNPHPNIISLYGAYTMNSYALSYGTEVGLLLEYCPGRSLAANCRTYGGP
jgi:mitogen-activated protein kinase kinase